MNLRQTFDSLSATAHRARIELLNENVEAWVARWRVVANAKSTIDIDYFIFSQDIFGPLSLGIWSKKPIKESVFACSSTRRA
jgi:hypothetical protein